MSAVYAWLRRHPRLVDGVLAAVLALGGLATALTMRRYLLIPVTFGLTIPVVFRRAHPISAFATVIAIGFCQVVLFVKPALPDVAILVLLYTVAAYTDRRISLTGLAICLLGSAAELAELYPHMVRASQRNWMLIGVILFAGPSLIAWVLGDSMRYRRAYYAGLEERAATLERDRDAQARIAAAAERARIARELHDVVAHNVSVMVVQADGASYALGTDPGRAREALAAISATGRQALTEMRVLLGVLRRDDEAQPAATAATAGAAGATRPALRAPGAAGPVSAAGGTPGRTGAAPPAAQAAALRAPGPAGTTGAAELAPVPGLGQLDELLDQARAAGLQVSCVIEGEPRPLPDGAALAAYRIIQESLTNTRKHAGQGARASVRLRYTPAGVELAVTDNGLGGAAASDGAGHGLTGMRERAAMYGGSVQASPGPDGGFQVTALLPIAAVRSGAA